MAPTSQTPSTSRKVKNYVKITKTITLGVASDKKNKKTIEKVKEKVRGMENTVWSFLTEKSFENDHVIDYERKDGSNVHMNLHLGVEMQIYIEVPGRSKQIPLDVLSWDTIGDVKTKFQDKEGTPAANELTLFFNGGPLDDLLTLEGCNITNDTVLYAVLLGEDKIKITVSPPGGSNDPVEVMVKLCSTVENLKRVIYCMVGFPVERQNLTFEGVLLENSKRLVDYKIQMGSLISLNSCSGTSAIKISVKTLTGRVFPVYVDSSDTVDALKKVIQCIEATPESKQRLVFAGKQLEDGCTLGYYNIQKECVIYLLLRLCGC